MTKKTEHSAKSKMFLKRWNMKRETDCNAVTRNAGADEN